MDLSQDTFYNLFLEELEALRKFDAARADEGFVPGLGDDPDVLRLTESLAFFSARTRVAAAGATFAAVSRMAAGTLDYLVPAMPAAAMLQVQPSRRVVDPMELRRGSVFRLQYADPNLPADGLSPGSGSPRDRVALLSTLESTTVLPISVDNAAVSEVRGRLALELTLRADVTQKSARELSFHVRRQGDYRSSLALHVALQQHVERASALRVGTVDEAECGVAFGAQSPSDPSSDFDGRNPFERIRSFFHFPEQDLYLRVSIPAFRAGWTSLMVRLWLDGDWPVEQGVSKESFLLFAVPATNTWPDLAAPLLYDGTKDSFLITGRATFDAAEPVRVRGVYRADAGMSPLLPFAVGSREEGYEALRPPDGGAMKLRVRVPGAFEKPAKLAVDADWSQPSLWSSTLGQATISLQQQRLQGVSYRLLGSVRRPRASPLSADAAFGLDVLSLRAQRFLDTRAIATMLRLLGASGDSPYRVCPDLIEQVEVRDVPDPSGGFGAVKRLYTVSLLERSPELAPLLVRFGERIRDLLEAWTEELVEVHISSHVSGARAGGTR